MWWAIDEWVKTSRPAHSSTRSWVPCAEFKLKHSWKKKQLKKRWKFDELTVNFVTDVNWLKNRNCSCSFYWYTTVFFVKLLPRNCLGNPKKNQRKLLKCLYQCRYVDIHTCVLITLFLSSIFDVSEETFLQRIIKKNWNKCWELAWLYCWIMVLFYSIYRVFEVYLRVLPMNHVKPTCEYRVGDEEGIGLRYSMV